MEKIIASVSITSDGILSGLKGDEDGMEPIELEIKSVIAGDGVTHLQYAVVG